MKTDTGGTRFTATPAALRQGTHGDQEVRGGDRREVTQSLDDAHRCYGVCGAYASKPVPTLLCGYGAVYTKQSSSAL